MLGLPRTRERSVQRDSRRETRRFRWNMEYPWVVLTLASCISARDVKFAPTSVRAIVIYSLRVRINNFIQVQSRFRLFFRLPPKRNKTLVRTGGTYLCNVPVNNSTRVLYILRAWFTPGRDWKMKCKRCLMEYMCVYVIWSRAEQQLKALKPFLPVPRTRRGE